MSLTICVSANRLEQNELKYISTRGGETLNLAQILTRGTASDNGLFVPEQWPQVSQQQLTDLLDGEYAEIAGRVLTHFGGDSLPGNIATEAVAAAMTQFSQPVGPPVTSVKDGLWLMELIHGPTLAFKDFALAPLAEIIARTLQHNKQHATVLCATSGDTGAATVSAFANRENLRAVVLFPEGGVSDFQRKQMTTTGADNVLALCVKGDFDLCQSLVKAMYQTDAAKDYGYTAVNSINIVRILLQTAYYFRTSGLIWSKTDKPCNFIVPTGNFGNVYAAYIAKQMGAPIKKLVVTSNDNDVLPRLFEKGVMQGQQTVKTISPSMDIQVSSNFERLLWHIKQQNGAAVESAQKSLESQSRYDLSASEMEWLNKDFSAVRCTESEANSAMQHMQTEHNRIVCPHTATAIHAFLRMPTDPDAETVIAETAHPAKFSQAVAKATGVSPQVPQQTSRMLQREEVMQLVNGEVTEIQSHIDRFFC